MGEEKRKGGEKVRSKSWIQGGDCARFWEQIKKGEGAVFFHVFQPSLAASLDEKSRGNHGKFSDLREKRLRVISGGKTNRKSQVFEV